MLIKKVLLLNYEYINVISLSAQQYLLQMRGRKNQKDLKQDYKPFDKRPIFQIMAKGDITIEKLLPTAVLLVGRTKAGKSTGHNWIVRNPMTGKLRDGRVVYQQTTSQGQQTGHNFNSETLIPGLINSLFKIGEKEIQISIADMGGFGDVRNYVGVSGISYMLREVFNKVKRVKFIITMSDLALSGLHVNDIQQPFLSFFDMMDFPNLEQELKLKIIDSTYFLLTMTKNVDNDRQQTKADYYQKIQGKINAIRREAKYISYGQQIIRLLNHFVESKKIIFLNEAVENVAPISPEKFRNSIIQEEGNWKFLQVDELRKVKNGEPIILPFQQSYEDLKNSDIKKFQQDIQWKTTLFKQFSVIVNLFFRKLFQGMNIFNNDISYAREFQLLKWFLQKYDIYRYKLITDEKTGTWEYLVQKHEQTKATFDFTYKEGDKNGKRINSLKLIKQIKKFYQNSISVCQDQIQKDQEQLKKKREQTNDNYFDITPLKMKVLQNNMMKALTAMKDIYTSSYQQEDVFIDTAYTVCRRSFKELWSLQGMDRRLVKSDQIIIGELNAFSEIELYEFEKKFIFASFGRYKYQLEEILQKNQSQFQQFIDYVENWTPRQNDKLRFQKILFELFMMKGDFFLSRKRYVESARNYVTSNQKLQHYIESVKDAHNIKHGNLDVFNQDIAQYTEQKDNLEQTIQFSKANIIQDSVSTEDVFGKFYENVNQIDFTKLKAQSIQIQVQSQQPLLRKYQIEILQIKLYAKIGHSLKKKCVRQSLELAIKIFQHIEHVQSACDVYEEILKLVKSVDEKWYFFDLYRKYTENHGRIQDSIKIHQRMIEIADSPLKKYQIKKEMFLLNEDQVIRNEQYFKESSQVIKNNYDLIEEVQYVVKSVLSDESLQQSRASQI